MRAVRTSLFSLLFLVSACAFTRDQYGAEKMLPVAKALTHLAGTMEMYVRYEKPSATLSEQQLLAGGTRDQPEILKSFDKLKIRLLNQERHVIVLVCTPGGERALLEDAGCTGEIETHHWKRRDVPCEFTLSPGPVCGPKK